MRRTLLTVLAVELALVGLGLTSCAESPLGPKDAAYVADARGVDRISSTNVFQSVSGNAHVMGEPVERTVTFEIRKHADGSVEGWYNAAARGRGGADIKVRVDCLHVVGNKAWAGGTIVEAVNPANIGRPVSLRFIDNGEGVNAPPDEFGGIWEYHDCATEPDLPTRQLTIGNLQVRG
jgi:hypothetical protein